MFLSCFLVVYISMFNSKWSKKYLIERNKSTQFLVNELEKYNELNENKSNSNNNTKV